MKNNKIRGILLLFVAVLHLFFLCNIQFTAWPEMLSYPYLVNHGFKLYADIIHPYPPLLTFGLAAVFKFTSQSSYVYFLQGITWGLILINDLLILKIVKHLTKKDIYSYLALALYVLTQPFLEGNMLWFDIALVTPILAGIYFLLNQKKENIAKNLLVAGVCFALAIFIKQTAALLLLVSSGYVLAKYKKTKALINFLTPMFIFGLVFLVWAIITHQLMDFLNWNLIYPFTFWSKFPGYVQMILTSKQIILLVFLLAPALVLVITKFKSLKNSVTVFLGVVLLTSGIMVYPRFSFFHFQLALALLVIVTGYTLSFVKNKNSIILLSFSYLVLAALGISRPILIRDWHKPVRFWDDANKLGSTISEFGTNDKKIYLLGISSDTYVTSNKLPPKPWPDNYGWYLEIPQIQDKILARWQQDPPYYVYWQIPQAGNWYDLGTYQPQKITDWITRNYELVDTIQDNIDIWQKRN